jgi:hypothetical protein
MGFHPDPWTPECVAELKRLWVERKPYSAIAIALGPQFTRNAIASKCRRFGMKRTPIPSDERPKKKVNPRKPKLVVIEAFEPSCIPLLQTGFAECRYPLWGDDGSPDYEVCGNSCGIVEPYCEHHAKICAGKGTHSERNVAKVPKADTPETEAA